MSRWTPADSVASATYTTVDPSGTGRLSALRRFKRGIMMAGEPSPGRRLGFREQAAAARRAQIEDRFS